MVPYKPTLRGGRREDIFFVNLRARKQRGSFSYYV